MKRSELVSLVRHLVNVIVSFYSRFKIIPLFIWAVSFNFMFVFRFLVSGVWLLVFDLAPWNFPSADALPYAVPMLLTSYVLMNAVFCRKPALYHNSTCVAGSKNLCGEWIYAWDLVVLKTIPLSSFRQTANITCTFFPFWPLSYSSFFCIWDFPFAFHSVHSVHSSMWLRFQSHCWLQKLQRPRTVY